MDRMFMKQMKKLDRKEDNILNPKDNPLLKNKILPFVDKIQEKVPEKLSAALETAFYKSFKLFFEKGNEYIEKTYNKEDKQFEFEINDYAIQRKFNNKSVKRLDKPANYSNIINTSFSVLEGSVLGALGIGLPDIPILISLMIKTINEVALSYGFNYNTPAEKTYILMLIRGALTKEEQQKEANKEIDSFGYKTDHQIYTAIDLEEQMKLTSSVLSDSLLTAKFIQGIPIVGAVGGIVNYNVIQKVGRYSKLKYKKRYLLKRFGSENKN
ncbi:EcsC family protein [Anaerocolumna sp. MB42-C2]|uniref:EcsC family protein n=1 Tax=Anaerocolumna sp. MB42-C2 TaxID=3070997 RepID=UPI0027E01EFF|nr:EcsC family protein [Anaerocolumna sp. MB42-C2]WMJ89845.1 EcsC family protein [Anaerocolumna sp. MB42-C2]